MNNPEYAKVKEKKYKINTDFRVAIECERIARDENIKDTERTLAIIYKLYGDEGLNNPEDWEKLLEIAVKYLTLNQEMNCDNEEPDMDFTEDRKYIRSSFIQDYKYNPYDMDYLHWWDFFNDLSNLSNSEFGNCCILNRIRNLRTFDVSQVKDPKERHKIIKAKEQVALKKKVKMTDKQKKSQDEFYKLLGGDYK